MFQWSGNEDMDDFISKYESELIDRHFLYVVQSGMESDNKQTTRQLRNRSVTKDESVYKLGKTRVGKARLRGYQDYFGYKGRGDVGVKVRFVQVIPKSLFENEKGVPTYLVDLIETALKRKLNTMGFKPVRGKEWFKIPLDKLLSVIESDEVQKPAKSEVVNRRTSERLKMGTQNLIVREVSLINDEIKEEIKFSAGVQSGTIKKPSFEETLKIKNLIS